MNIRYPIYEGVYRILTYQLTFDFNNETEDEDSVVTADSKELPVTIVGH